MRVTLLHNPKAGSGEFSREHLIDELERAGHQVTCYSVKSKKFPRGLDNPKDVVLVAGGDGSVRKVASRFIGRNVPLAILPIGTANNIARGLGLSRSPHQIIRRLSRAKPIRFDVGMIRGPWGDVPFFEGAGIGLFPRMMAHHLSNRQQGIPDAIDRHEGIEGGRKLLQELLQTFRGRKFAIKTDHAEFTGKFLLIEAMNIRSIGPSLRLAPEADPGDGLLEVVVVRENDREALLQHLNSSPNGKTPAPFNVLRTRDVKITCSADEFHFDDELWPKPARKENFDAKLTRNLKIEITVFPGALKVLMPE